MTNVIDLDVDDWRDIVLEATKPVIVEYWHDKCKACTEMKPFYEQLPDRLNNVIVTRLNVLTKKENRRFAIKQGIRSTPTIKVYCKGRAIGEIIGIRTLEKLESEINYLLKNQESCLLSTPLDAE